MHPLLKSRPPDALDLWYEEERRNKRRRSRAAGGTARRIPPPASAPEFTIVGTLGQSVNFRLQDADRPRRRGKPDGVQCAMVLMHVGEHAPVTPEHWALAGFFTRTTGTLTLTFDAARMPGGTKVWLTACWANPRGEGGPCSNPVSFYIAGGIANAA